MEEWIIMLLSLNAAIQLVRMLSIEGTCKCKELLAKKEAEHEEEYNKLVQEFNANDEKHVDDYNLLVDENTELEEQVMKLEEQLEEKTERVTHFRKRVHRLESRLARNTKPQLE
jgi:hypothetical protein